MKITAIDNVPIIVHNITLGKATYNLTVEMTQEEYRLCCYFLEKEKREKKK